MESKRVPRKLKWTSIPKDDMASKPCAAHWPLPMVSYQGKGRPVAKPIANKKENDLRQIGKIQEKRRGRRHKALIYKPISKEGE